MTCARIIISAQNAERLEKAQEWAEQQRNYLDILVLAPIRGAADDFAVNLCLENGSLLGIQRMTVAQLAPAIAIRKMAEKDLVPLNHLGLEALAARCIHDCLQGNRLDFFRPVAGMPGFARALARTLSDLRLEAVKPDRLTSLGKPGKDLALLLSLFEDQLEMQSVADLTTLLKLATEVIKVEGGYLVGIPLLLLDIPLRSSVEKAFFKALTNRSPATLATAFSGDTSGIKALEEVIGVKAERFDTPRKAALKTSLWQVQHSLFSPTEMPASTSDESLVFFSAPGEGRECVDVARRILQAAEEGILFDQMAVFLRDSDVYQPQLEDVFRRAGIPGYFSRGTVRPHPAGRAFLALLVCALEGISASRFAEYLSFGQVRALDDSRRPSRKEASWVRPTDKFQMTFKTVAADAGELSQPNESEEDTDKYPVVSGTLWTSFHWERLLVDAAVIGGKDRWIRRLNGLEAELELKSRETDEENAQKLALQKQLQRLRNLKSYSVPLVEFLDSLPARASWGQWLDVLRQLAAKALRRPDSVLAVLSELEPMAQIGPVELSDVRGVLAEQLTFLRNESFGKRYGHVFVGTPQEAAARSFEVVFLPGLAEGIFPRKALEDPLLLDEHREKLSATLAVRKGEVEEERLRLRIVAGAACLRLVISYPRMDVTQGRARVPSLYALEVLRAARGCLPELRELEKWAEETSETRLGWPAPQDSRRAIDDAEYDLSVLDSLLHKPDRKIVGRGRFLLQVNSCLARSLRARYKRWKPDWSDDDGIVTPNEEVRRILEQHRLSSRAYSPTALQAYAACPYRFLLYTIHHLRPREKVGPIEQMDPLTRGSLFHAIQFELFRKLEAAGLLPMKPDNLEQVINHADDVLDRVAGDYEEKLAPAIAQVWESAVEDLRVDLRCWIREVTRTDQQWEPIHFEYSFGLPFGSSRDAQSSEKEAVILNGMRLRGSIDLVEKNKRQEVLRITDHKTGKVPWQRPQFVGNGEVLQPLLYGLAAEKLLGLPVETGRLFYCTQQGDFQQYSVSLSKEAQKRIQQVIDTIDQAIKSGFLPAAPRKNACRFCDYRPVCGPYEEFRTGQKRREVLGQLEAIRKIP